MPETPSASASAANRITVGDRLERTRHQRRVLVQVVREPRARELTGERERREECWKDRRVADAPVEAHPHDRLEVLDPAGRRPRIERADHLPVLGRADRATHAGPVAVLAELVALDAPPRFDRVAAARRDLEEVRAVALVEPQRRLREPGGGAVHRREVAPDGVGHAVDRLAVDRRQDALASAQLLHARRTPLLSTGSPRSLTASKATRSPARPRPCTVNVDGIRTMPVKRAASMVTRVASPPRS